MHNNHRYINFKIVILLLCSVVVLESERAVVPTEDDGSQELFGTPCSSTPCYQTSQQAPAPVSASLAISTVQRSTAASDPVITQAVVYGIQKQPTLQLPKQASKRYKSCLRILFTQKADYIYLILKFVIKSDKYCFFL